MRWPALLPLAVAALPGIASAQAISTAAGLFNIIAGLMLVAGMLMYFGGLIMWFARLGTSPTYRDEAIKMMQWAVVVMFVLAILLFVVRFVQSHEAAASFIVGIVVLCLAGWLILTAATAKPEGDDHH